ncbi:MAG: hypothetical protein F6J93_37165 [Oscillatoria sp. SIO1A7]|nr:hypothetical protein [Oscillatoria sp. SIO1A7]
MELKKAMQRKTNILQLVSICLGAVLALSMVLLPVNAAFASDTVTACEELAIPQYVKVSLNESCPGDKCEVIKKFYTRRFPDVKNCEPACKGLAIPQNVKNSLNEYCPGDKCEAIKKFYTMRSPDVEKYIDYQCE